MRCDAILTEAESAPKSFALFFVDRQLHFAICDETLLLAENVEEHCRWVAAQFLAGTQGPSGRDWARLVCWHCFGRGEETRQEVGDLDWRGRCGRQDQGIIVVIGELDLLVEWETLLEGVVAKKCRRNGLLRRESHV